MRSVDDFKTTTNSRVYRQLRRELCTDIGCTICPPHAGENATRQPKHKKKKAYQLDASRRH